MAKTRRVYSGNATPTTVPAGLAAAATSCTISASTGWPGSGPFYVVVSPGTAAEEKVLVGAISGTTLSSLTRGVDGTSDQTHSPGAAIYPVFTAVDADEANELASKWTTKGDLVSHGASTFATVSVGTNSHVLQADSAQAAGIKWGQVATAGIADDAVTAAKIATGAVGSSELATGSVETAKIADAAVTADKVATAVAGSGLAGGGGTALSVNVDDTGIEINSDTLRLKDSGVVTAKIADDAVTLAKVATEVDDAMGLRKLATVTLSSVSNAVSNVFSSTYDAYRVVISDLNNGSATQRAVSLRFRTSSDDTGSNYFSGIYNQYGTNLSSEASATGQSSAELLSIADTTNDGGAATFDIINPNLAKATVYCGHRITFQAGGLNVYIMSTIYGGVNTNTQYTGFSIIGVTDNLSGTVTVYGYRK